VQPTQFEARTATTVPCPEAPQIFSMLVRLKTRLCVAVDEGLRREHDLPLELFDAMRVIADSSASCDSARLAESLEVGRHDADTAIDALVAAGHASRSSAAARRGVPPVALTLTGELLLKRAGRTMERVLRAQLDPILSPADQERLHASLRILRSRQDITA
jgi:DNA-binding MarR family transcriptional regulator